MSKRFNCCAGALPLIFMVGMATSEPVNAAICNVANTGTDAGSGTWVSPMNLQTALADANCTEIWVKTGVHKPNTADADPRMATFRIQHEVGIYGGFAGNETQRVDRNPVLNPTTLSGDIGLPGNNSDNSYTVVSIGTNVAGGNITTSTVIDGFTISDGNADGNFPLNAGGGMYCSGTLGGNNCSPTLSNVIFSNNNAWYGGAMYNNGFNGGIASPVLSHVSFNGNSAITSGGAIYNEGGLGTSSPVLFNVTFSENSANYGGAIFSTSRSLMDAPGVSSPSLGNVTFSDNSAATAGGAIYNSGTNNGNTSPSFSNVTFSNNTSGSHGGAMYNAGIGGNSNPVLSNVTFTLNHAGGGGGAIFNSGGNPVLSNLILWGNMADGVGGYAEPEITNAPGSPMIDHSVVQGSGGSDSWNTALGSDGGGNLDANPALGALGGNGGFTQTHLLGSGSSAIDTGNDSTCSAAPVNNLDQRAKARPQGPHCDIGAVEHHSSDVIDFIYADGFELAAID